MRWTPEKNERLQALQATEAGLSDAERAELQQLLGDRDADEADDQPPITHPVESHAAELAAQKTKIHPQADELARIAAEQAPLSTDATGDPKKPRPKSGTDDLFEELERTVRELRTAVEPVPYENKRRSGGQT